MAEARAALAAFDPYITLWWSETRRLMSDPARPGRWRVMEWMPRRSAWIEFCTWETREKRYLPPWPVSGIIARVGRGRIRMDLAAQLAEDYTAKMLRERETEFRENLTEHARDLAERAVGSRATPRSILRETSETEDGLRRRRAASIGGMFRRPQPLSNHEKYIADHFKKQLEGT